MALASLILAFIALVIAAASASYTRRQAREQTRATSIEIARRHDELTPVFGVSCRAGEADSGSATMRVSLTGGALDGLDSVVITVLDESGKDRWGHGLPDGVSEQEAQAFVWGPWELDTAAGAQVISNRRTVPRAYSRTDGTNWDVLVLRATRPGRWMTDMSQADWTRQYKDHPVRLLITCHRDSYQPWFVQPDVQVEHRKVAAIRVME